MKTCPKCGNPMVVFDWEEVWDNQIGEWSWKPVFGCQKCNFVEG